jgi:hypothetical protein
MNPWCPISTFCVAKKQSVSKNFAHYSEEVFLRLNREYCPLEDLLTKAGESYAIQICNEAKGLAYAGTTGGTNWDMISKKFPHKQQG